MHPDEVGQGLAERHRRNASAQALDELAETIGRKIEPSATETKRSRTNGYPSSHSEHNPGLGRRADSEVARSVRRRTGNGSSRARQGHPRARSRHAAATAAATG